MSSYFLSPARSYPSYEYPDISAKPQTFRVITLLSPLQSSLPFGSPTVRIKLTEATIGVSDYETLSYTWGSTNSPPDRPVIVETSDGPRTILIFRSLEQTLLEFSASGQVTRPIFVDQICINQRDNDEKGAQVQLMGSIYSDCRRVVVWLGPGTKPSDDFFDFSREICEQGLLGRYLGPRRAAFTTIFDAVMDNSILVTGIDKEERDEILTLIGTFGKRFPLNGIIDVLGRSWFTRLWIIQEACLAPELTFAVGSRSLCYDCFRIGILFYTIYNTHWIGTVSHAVPKEEVHRRDRALDLNKNFVRIVHERRAIHTLGGKQSFPDLVLKYNVNDREEKIGASLPEDRLFGFMGIAAEDVAWRGVKVMYGQVEEVYTDFAGILVRERPDMLAFSQFPKHLVGLPSWVPDWSTSLHTARGYVELRTPAFNAGGDGSSGGRWFHPEAKSFTLQGIYVDEIVKIGSSFVENDTDSTLVGDIEHQSAKRFFNEVDAFIQEAATLEQSPIYNASEELRLRTRIRLSDFGITEKYFAEKFGPEEAGKLVLSVHQHVDRWGAKLIQVEGVAAAHRLGNILGLIDYRSAQHWAPPAETDLLMLSATDPVGASTALLGAVSACCADIAEAARASIHLNLVRAYLDVRRRYASMSFAPSKSRDDALKAVGLDPNLTFKMELKDYKDNMMRNAGQRVYLTRKGYVGVGPPSMKPGDAVAVFLGATVPHVLRPQGADWQYLGETYCAGIMEGEMLQQSGVTTRDFTLV